MNQHSAQADPWMTHTVAPCTSMGSCAGTGLVSACQLLAIGVFCCNVDELTEELSVSKQTVLDSIEALTLVQADALGEMFRLRERAG